MSQGTFPQGPAITYPTVANLRFRVQWFNDQNVAREDYVNFNQITPPVDLIGTASTGRSIVDVTTAFSQSALNNNFATVVASLNDILSILQSTQSD